MRSPSRFSQYPAPSKRQIAWLLESLGVRQTFVGGEPSVALTLQTEYGEMLAQRPLDELQRIAQARRIEPQSTSQRALAEELASRLCDVQETCDQIARVSPTGLRILAYLNLVLTPGRGLSSENALTECSAKLDSPYLDPSNLTAPPAEEKAELDLIDPDGIDDDLAYPAPDPEHRQDLKRVSAQIAALVRHGLLLPFRQHSATYYSVPLAVRACLPPHLYLPAATFEDQEPEMVPVTSHPQLLNRLYAVWEAVSLSSAQGHAIASRPTPPRQPSEDRWTALEEWSHLPSEVNALDQARSARTLAGGSRTVTQAMTVPTPAFRLEERNLAFLQAETGCGDEEIEFYLCLLYELGALDIQPGKEIACSSEQMQRFLSLPTALQIHKLAQVWIAETRWSEMDVVLRSGQRAERDGNETGSLGLRRNLMYAEYRPADLYQEWRAGRLAILRFLSAIPEGQWIPIKPFLRALYEINARYLHTQSAPMVWWLESDKTKRQFGTTFDDWQRSYGQFAVTTIEKPLAWLGVVSVAYRQGLPTAFRITPTGRMVLGHQGSPERVTDQQPDLAFGDGMTITLIPNQVPMALHELLRAVGQAIKVTPEEFTYRLTADGIRRWCESSSGQGSDSTGYEAAIDRLVSLLIRLTGVAPQRAPIASLWRDTLRTWVRHYGQTHVYEDLTLLDLADDYALQELLASTSLRQHILYQFSPRLVAVRPGAVDELVAEMEARGYTPRVE